MGLGPVRGAEGGERIRSQLHFEPKEAETRSLWAPNCQMVNIFAPFQQSINCRAARGLRRTDQCGRGFWPWLSPQTPSTGETVRVQGWWGGMKVFRSQSFAYWATWALTFWGFKSEADDDQTGLRVFWERKQDECYEFRQGGEGWKDQPPVILYPPCHPPFPPPAPPFPAPKLLVYISPKDVIELNKAFLRGSCHSCCLWHVKRPATLRALTYAPN